MAERLNDLAIPVSLTLAFPSLKRVQDLGGHLFSLKPKPLPLVATDCCGAGGDVCQRLYHHPAGD